MIGQIYLAAPEGSEMRWGMLSLLSVMASRDDAVYDIINQNNFLEAIVARLRTLCACVHAVFHAFN
jgi:hypothetical protein